MLTPQASKRFNKLLEGYAIISAIIASKERIVLITKEVGGEEGLEYHELETDFVLYNPRFNKDKHGISGKGWCEGIRKAWGAFTGDSSGPTVFCDHMDTCEFISDEKWSEDTGWKNLPQTAGSMFRGLWGIKNIDGDVYMAGLMRKVYKRVGQQKWEDLTSEEQHPNLHADVVKRIEQKESLVGFGIGFLALDGFNKHDIYACGSGSDLWHYDGKSWTRLDPPANFDMSAILCAPDGYVYIGGRSGAVLKGKYDAENGEDWEILDSPVAGKINSLAWFKGVVYAAEDYGLYTIDTKGKVKEYQFPEDGITQYSFSNVVSCEEALLSYGPDQALVFDGTSWEQLVGNIIVQVPDVLS